MQISKKKLSGTSKCIKRTYCSQSSPSLWSDYRKITTAYNCTFLKLSKFIMHPLCNVRAIPKTKKLRSPRGELIEPSATTSSLIVFSMSHFALLPCLVTSDALKISLMKPCSYSSIFIILSLWAFQRLLALVPKCYDHLCSAIWLLGHLLLLIMPYQY